MMSCHNISTLIPAFFRFSCLYFETTQMLI